MRIGSRGRRGLMICSVPGGIWTRNLQVRDLIPLKIRRLLGLLHDKSYIGVNRTVLQLDRKCTDECSRWTCFRTGLCEEEPEWQQGGTHVPSFFSFGELC
ncbi:hypothetical protein AVEN_171864-1 [Araneus ventricosus]|uniref:Uncharacterized protein n=1 Tax=Araneus ventricosus TaxID=182803 RepID=A0A4Y2QGJ0_ARAVE|nr:hypothetical protein AVEN_69175-1 [Araneus ventricosus]GBN62006.1 hypothetical protein AVEN_171864-1 [Araneus ventricosus]